MNLYKSSLVIAPLLAGASVARAQFIYGGFSDVRPTVSGGKLVTNAHDDSSGNDVPSVRVFEYRFQNDPLDPYFTQDPGFNATTGALPPGATFRFDILSSLSYWSGSGAVSQGVPPASEGLQFTFGASSVTLNGSSGAQSGFPIAIVSSNGALHKHLNAFLLASDGNADPTDGIVATPGVYFATMNASVSSGASSSDPLYLVYGNGVTNEQLFKAVKYSRDTFAPGTNLANVIGLWAVNSGGVWSQSTNWDGGVPSGVSVQASFTSAITAPKTVTVDAPFTVGTVNFDNANQYTIAGTSTITLQMYGAPVGINVLSGSHVISAPIALKNNLIANVPSPSSALTISSDVSADPGVQISKIGDGLLAMKNVRADALAISAGTMGGGMVQILSNGSSAATSNIKTLSVAAGTTLDLANNAMVIDYSGSSPLATIRSLLVTGFNAGSWTGTGITSSTAASVAINPAIPHKTALGYAESGAPQTFAGQSVDSTAVLLRYTLAGDANLDASVDTVDFNLLAASFSGTGKDWFNGDFNYDGSVDTVDFNILAANFSASIPASFPMTVPEPASVTIISYAWLAWLVPRRRCRC